MGVNSKFSKYSIFFDFLLSTLNLIQEGGKHFSEGYKEWGYANFYIYFMTPPPIRHNRQNLNLTNVMFSNEFYCICSILALSSFVGHQDFGHQYLSNMMLQTFINNKRFRYSIYLWYAVYASQNNLRMRPIVDEVKCVKR